MQSNMYKRGNPITEPENDSHNNEIEQAKLQRPAPARRNPRLLLIGHIDFDELLMEIDELQ